MLAGSLPGVAASAHTASVHAQSHSQSRFQNQFHFKPAGRRATQAAAHMRTAKHLKELGKNHQHAPLSKNGGPGIQSHLASARNVRRHTANPPIGKTGFLSALEIPLGNTVSNTTTYAYDSGYSPVSGDFNGDGIPDVASEVETDTNGTYAYAISVVLSNGDGTFQSAILNPITDTCAALVVGDVNNDGKSDLIIGHTPNNCGNTNTQPTFDVWVSNGDGTFTPSSNTTNNTIAVSGLAGGTVADVNNDGVLDIVLVDDGNPANVWTLIGVGDGTFNGATPAALPSQAGYGAIIADVNNDGFLDIVDVDYSTYEVTVYIAISATSWNTPNSYLTPDNNYNACGMTLGDLNGDGLPEIVTANCSDAGNDITVYVNNGNNTFGDNTGTGTYYDAAMSGGTNSGPAVVYTEAVTVADVNGDGLGDIIASNDDSSDVTILFGKADGTVTVPTSGYAVGGYPYNQAIVADFNGDGFADIVVSDDEFSLVYLRGYGDGTFRAALNYYAPTEPTAYADSVGIASGDFNKDGHPDFVTANYCSSCANPMGISVFLSNPDGSMQPAVNYGTTSDLSYVAVGDFNGDKNLDIAAIENSTGMVQIFNGDGTGSFGVPSLFSTDLTINNPQDLVAADFNNDGFTDLAVANWNGSDIAILLSDNTNPGNFLTPAPITLSNSVYQGFAVADLRGVGKLDIVAPMYYGGAVAVLLGNGDGTFGGENDYPLSAGSDLAALTVADLDGDGKLDVAVTLQAGGGQDITWALGAGDGTFGSFSTPVPSSLQDINFNTPYPQYIQAADVDGDGITDLVYVNTDYSTIGVLFGKGTVGNPSYYDPVEFPVGGYNWDLVVTDLNDDGTPDVVTSSDDFAGVTSLLNNNGSGTLGTFSIALTSQSGTVTAGGTATYTFTITPTKHYNGTVTFSCPTGLPALTSCSFTPSAVVTLDGLNPQTVTLTITTKAPSTAALRTRASVEPQSNPRPPSSAMLLASLNGIGVFGMFLAGGLNKKRTRWSVLAIFTLAMTFFLVGCGGSSNSTPPPPTKADSTSSVTSSAATVLVGQQVTFTGTVSGTSGTPTGTVTFLDGSTTLGTGTLSSGSATLQTSSLAAGVHAITISYGGDSNFNASTSTAFSQTVDNPGTATGSYPLTVSATGTAGTNGVTNGTQQVVVNLTVQ